MFEVSFFELTLIFGVALMVLGPTRLPKLVSKVGRWVGKARSMARDFRQQLESEVNLEELNKFTEEQTRKSRTDFTPPPPPELSGEPLTAASTPTYPYAAAAAAAPAPKPGDDTYSHAHAEGEAPPAWTPEPYPPEAAGFAAAEHTDAPDDRPPDAAAAYEEAAPAQASLELSVPEPSGDEAQRRS